ncbi:MAG: hypothetical protein OEX12_00245 [Gammaproteobacteria bacterium]|nr:hypothetical protein [Gammaproteobacteria bacterium]
MAEYLDEHVDLLMITFGTQEGIFKDGIPKLIKAIVANNPAWFVGPALLIHYSWVPVIKDRISTEGGRIFFDGMQMIPTEQVEEFTIALVDAGTVSEEPSENPKEHH